MGCLHVALDWECGEKCIKLTERGSVLKVLLEATMDEWSLLVLESKHTTPPPFVTIHSALQWLCGDAGDVWSCF